MAKITRNAYQFKVREFDAETNAHIEQARRQSLARQPSIMTPLAETLLSVFKDLAQVRPERKAA